MRRTALLLLVWGCGSKDPAPAVPPPDHVLHRTHTVDGVTIVGKAVPLATQPMLDWIGLPMSGDIDVAINVRTHGGNLREASGSIAITCPAGCRLGDDKTKITPATKNPRTATFIGDGLEFGHIDFDRIDIAATIVDGKATITRWDAVSEDIEIKVSGSLQLGTTLADSPIDACLRFQGTPALADRDPKTAAVLATTGGTPAADGMFNIQLTDKLGTLKLRARVCDGSAPSAASDVLAAGTGSAASPPADNKLDPAVAALITKAITKKSNTSYEVRHAVWEQLLAQPTQMAKGGRVVPAIRDGKAIGFKIYAVQPESLYAHLGLQNGDTLLSIAGHALTTADEALETYARVRAIKRGGTVAVTLDRKGTQLTLTYTLR